MALELYLTREGGERSGVGAQEQGGHLSGKAGEYRVAKRLAELPPDEYLIVNDVMLPTKDDATTQVDHVVVSRFGVFVVETKDYSGWIFGDASQARWTQVMGRGKQKNRFQNPIRQNWRHIAVISELLGVPADLFRSVVAFCGEADFKTEMPEGVIYSKSIAKYITSFQDAVISPKNVPEIAAALREWEATVSDEKRRGHVENLKRRHDASEVEKAVNAGEMKCPCCGAKMVLRRRRSDHGAFYGCSAYPKCRYTINQTGEQPT